MAADGIVGVLLGADLTTHTERLANRIASFERIRSYSPGVIKSDGTHVLRSWSYREDVLEPFLLVVHVSFSELFVGFCQVQDAFD